MNSFAVSLVSFQTLLVLTLTAQVSADSSHSTPPSRQQSIRPEVDDEDQSRPQLRQLEAEGQIVGLRYTPANGEFETLATGNDLGSVDPLHLKIFKDSRKNKNQRQTYILDDPRQSATSGIPASPTPAF